MYRLFSLNLSFESNWQDIYSEAGSMAAWQGGWQHGREDGSVAGRMAAWQGGWQRGRENVVS